MSDRFDFKAEAEVLRPKLVAWRRDFHMHPELSFQEYRSAEVIAACLNDLGYEVQAGVAQTGVVGLLKGISGRFDFLNIAGSTYNGNSLTILNQYGG